MSSWFVIVETQASAQPLADEYPVLNKPLDKTSCPKKDFIPRTATAFLRLITISFSTLDCKALTAPASVLPMLKARVTAVVLCQSLPATNQEPAPKWRCQNLFQMFGIDIESIFKNYVVKLNHYLKNNTTAAKQTLGATNHETVEMF